MMSSGMDMGTLALKLLEGLEPNLLDESVVEYRCDCSEERVSRALISLGEEELEAMAAEGIDTEVACHFCNKKYSFTPDEIRKLKKS